METAYKTVAAEATAEYVDRRSRFIATVRPVTDEESALRFIAEKKKEYWDARHNVYAYVLRESGISRFSDDNEPQGTAGLPTLEVLQKQGLTDCVVVVTRYFGGILLGTGGLVRAYSQSAAQAVANAGVVERRLCTHGEIVCDYAQYGWLQSLIPECGGRLDDAVFADDVTVLLHFPVEDVDAFCARLTDRSCGALTFQAIDEEFDTF
ncbi:MAG: YigZ family protein [Clostridia bacterium]|nr:YigZ family protein [Clostridia bacterium]